MMPSEDGPFMTVDLNHRDEGEKDAQQFFRTKERLTELSSRLLNAQEEERKRIAHEVHENLAQALMAIQFRVEAALSEMEEVSNPKLMEHLEPVIGILQEGLGSIRRIAWRLRPMILDDLGLLVTVSRLCRQLAEDHPGIGVVEKFEIEEREIPESLKLVIYRILESVMFSLLKQEPCGVVEVCLGRNGPLISLTIRAHAQRCGSEPLLSVDERPASFSCATIGERAMLSGGTVTVVSHDGGGTTLQVTWPTEGV